MGDLVLHGSDPAISFLGYIAVRAFGATRGLIVSALLGAVISSTAVTLALARNTKSGKDPFSLSGAAARAAMVSVARVILVVAVVEPRILALMGPAALPAAFGLCGAVLLYWHGGHGDVAPPARSPFDLGPLLVFALVFAIATANAVWRIMSARRACWQPRRFPALSM